MNTDRGDRFAQTGADGAPTDLPPVDATSVAVPAWALPPDLLASLLADGDADLATWTLRNAIAERGRAVAYDELLWGAMSLVGDRWQTGRWGIAEEHLASQTLLRALDEVRPSPDPDAAGGPLAVLAGVAGEHHFIGLVCFAHLLEADGWQVANLGADVPPAEVARFVERQAASLVALTASLEDRLPVVAGTIQAVREATAATGGVDIVLGGRLAARPGIADALRIEWAGSSLAAALPVVAAMRQRRVGNA